MTNTWVLQKHYTGRGQRKEVPTQEEIPQAQVDEREETTLEVSEFWFEGDPMPQEIAELDAALRKMTPAFLAALDRG